VCIKNKIMTIVHFNEIKNGRKIGIMGKEFFVYYTKNSDTDMNDKFNDKILC